MPEPCLKEAELQRGVANDISSATASHGFASRSLTIAQGPATSRVVEGNPQRLASVVLSALEDLVASCAVKTTITTTRAKTAWSLNFDVNAFDLIGGKGRRSLLGAKLATNVSRRFTVE